MVFLKMRQRADVVFTPVKHYAGPMLEPSLDFTEACASKGLDVKPGALPLLAAYLTRLLEINQVLNLTAVRDPAEAWMRHIYESLCLLPCLKADPDQCAVDLGSGGGLPGIPLAIARPDMRWILVESVGKKARFLQETAEALGLSNVEVRAERAEILGRDPDLRENVDLVTARAVAPLPVLLELAIPLIKVRGTLLAMKGQRADEEVRASGRALDMLHARVHKEIPQPGGGKLLIIRKFEATGKRYPRPVGQPAKEPL
jgi:16S rRNA (guanine527-N7)-methyltransferase